MSLIPPIFDERLEALFDNDDKDLIFSCDGGKAKGLIVMGSRTVDSKKELDAFLDGLSVRNMRGNVSLRPKSGKVRIETEEYLNVPKATRRR